MGSVLAIGLAMFMFVTGVAHLTAPAYFRGLVPSWVPVPSAVVTGTGLCNIAVAALLVAPATRTVGAWATAALITAYLPAHLDAARRVGTATRLYDRWPGVVARVVVNLGYIDWVVAAAVSAG